MRTVLLVVFLLPVLMVAAHPAPGSSKLVVSLKSGQIRGEYVTVKGTERRVKQYLGIPFAKPPVGPLRFAAPESPEPWEGERDGTQQPPMCVQDREIIVNISKALFTNFTVPEVSEDCLYLNVYTPAETTPEVKLPVMVWIHSAGFLAFGAASMYDGSSLTAYENVVTVVIQYRLGILGFLSTGDAHAKGNWGFLDQLAALRWVQENIEAFGGDPQSVTIAGESAGGFSASILTLSPLSKGLFHKAIFQSGVATLGGHTSDRPLNQAHTVARLAGCYMNSTEELVQCLRGKTQDELISVGKQIKIILGATVDGEFLPGTPEVLLQRKEVLNIPVMMGVTNHEFGWMLPQIFTPPGWDKGMNLETVMVMVPLFNPKGSFANILIVIKYLKDAKTPQDIRDAFTEVIGDLVLVLPTIKVAGYHTDAGAPVYMYEFVYVSDRPMPNRPSFVKADHADDVGYMFGVCFWNGHIRITVNCTDQDERFSRTMMSYWGSFARTGSPNGPGLVNWPLYDRQKQEYMELGQTQSVKQKLKKDKVDFVTAVLP
ncbi:fatty acyl-CoA hydrolase precursor, medium chain-like [Xiphophorus hellerii]|uniref:fatty acyl-CoA hydrolase precursor, medium chain-like n=1 Tax=Xiphophorus hellerii TaxID=8084 RepID=UPI0013B3928E|nr:fatty acyl-CoA hydrolase precursor, medium chain-like [Xiphophorus hellerii]